MVRDIHENGVGPTWRLVLATTRKRLHFIFDRKFDRTSCIETYEFDNVLKSTVSAENFEHAVGYQGTPSILFRQMMRKWPCDLSDFVFVDFGSGKGRVLLLASEYRFKEIIGVEFCTELHNAAINNLRNFDRNGHLRGRIRLLNLDATEFDIPNEKCIFYFFHPFLEPVMRKVVGKIRTSYTLNPRPLYFIYLFPVHRTLLDEQSFLRRMKIPNPLLPLLSPYPITMYRSCL